MRPATLRKQGNDITWIRRSRIEGDGWDGADVPLGEESERYLLRLIQAGQVVAEAQTQTPSWTIPAAVRDQLQPGQVTIEVAQLSQTFGRGPFARRDSMPSETARLQMALLQPAQAQKHVTVNEALMRLEALVNLVLQSVSTQTPPATVLDGQCWGVPAARHGAWVGQDGAHRRRIERRGSFCRRPAACAVSSPTGGGGHP